MSKFQFTTSAIALAALIALAQPTGSAVAGTEIAKRDGWIITTTPHSYGDLVEAVNAAVKKSPVNVVTRASATVGAKSLGKTIPGNMIVGVYGPQFAVRMLEASVQAGIEAPIRLYITEDADGATTLSYKTPSAVFAPYNDDGGEALIEMAAELDAIFAQIVDDATAQ